MSTEVKKIEPIYEIGESNTSEKSNKKLNEPSIENQTLVAISWENICYTIKDRQILFNLTGRAIPGRALALMGSSGAGKTTFLNAISDRLGNKGENVLTGDIRLNEISYQREFRRLFGYVPQDDIIGATDTPLTAFLFAIRIRRGTSGEEATRRINETIELLRLTNSRNTIVGIPGFIQGLSGGERKRTNIGVELIADTKFLLLDEPTSGLDSNTAKLIVQTLQDIARKGRTVIYTIHQPTAEMLESFDDIMLLTGGKVAYHGPMNQSLEYFESIGFVCPENFTPTDYFMVLLQDPEISKVLVEKWSQYLDLNGVPCFGNIFQDKKNCLTGLISKCYPSKKKPNSDESNNNDLNNGMNNENQEETTENNDVLMENIVSSEEIEIGPSVDSSVDLKLKNALQPVPLSLFAVPGLSDEEDPETTSTMMFIRDFIAHSGSSYWIQFQELVKRSYRTVFKNYQYVIIILGQHIIFAFITAAIFHDLEDSITGVQDRMGMLFMISSAKAMNTAVGTINNFRPQKALFIREQQNGAYSPTIFFLSNFLAETPLFAFATMIEAVMIYFATKLHLATLNFFIFYFALLGTSAVCASFGVLLGIAVDDQIIAATLLTVINAPMMMVGGLIATTNHIRPYWIWLEKISWIRYCMVILLHNEFSTIGNLSCDVKKYGPICTPGLYPKDGPAVLHYFVFDDKQGQPWVMWLSMACMFVFIRLIGLIAIHVIARSKF